MSKLWQWLSKPPGDAPARDHLDPLDGGAACSSGRAS